MKPEGGNWEVDIVDQVENVPIEISVGSKSDKQLNVKAFPEYTKAILTTNGEDKETRVEQAWVRRIPYFKLAILLDLKSFPEIKEKETTYKPTRSKKNYYVNRENPQECLIVATEMLNDKNDWKRIERITGLNQQAYNEKLH